MAPKAEKETVDILGIEVFATGTHNGDAYDVGDLELMVGAADKVGFEAPVKLGHMEDDDTAALLKKEGLPAFGWVRNLRVQGKKLLADFMEVPKRLGELIKKGAYRRVSAEIYWNFQKGKDVFPRVLKAVSLLGAEIPAVTDLAGIEALYKKLGLEAKGKDEAGHEFRTYMGETWGGLQLKHKEDVAYRLSDGTLERCGTCRFYLGNAELGAVGSCTLVHGEIAAEGICDLYEAREAYLFPGGIEEAEAEAARKKKRPPRTYTIEKRGDEWCLVSKSTGKTLGCHPSEAAAQAQEAAIKAKQGGYGQDERLVLWMSREAVARACPECAKQMEFAGIRALKITYDPATKLYAGFSEGLCNKFAPGDGFRTRCMDSSVGAAADDPGAMCNALEDWCFNNGYLASKTSEGQGAKASGDATGAIGAGHAHAHVAEGGGMDERDKKIAELTAKIAELEGKLASERANASAVTMELPALKQQLTEAQEEIRKVRADRRSDRIKAFVADMVRQKRVIPAMAGDLARDLEHCDDQKVITFQQDGKDVKQTQLEARMAFYQKLPVQEQFGEKELTRGEGGGHAEGAVQPGDIKGEVHAKVIKYQNDHGGPTKIGYKDAMDAVFAADQDLKERYALAGR